MFKIICSKAVCVYLINFYLCWLIKILTFFHLTLFLVKLKPKWTMAPFTLIVLSKLLTFNICYIPFTMLLLKALLYKSYECFILVHSSINPLPHRRMFKPYIGKWKLKNIKSIKYIINIKSIKNIVSTKNFLRVSKTVLPCGER